MSEGYIGSSVQRFHTLLEQMDFLLFFTALTSILRFLTCIVTKLYFSRIFSNVDKLSLQTALSVGFCKWFLRLSVALSQHVQTKGQGANLDLLKDFSRSARC